MHRALAACLMLAASSALGQAAPSLPTFDVASVRPSAPGGPQHSNVPLDSGNIYGTVSADDARTAAGGLFIATHQALWHYISFAWSLNGTQELSLRFNMFSGAPKSGAPTWVTGTFDSAAEPFDIEARAPADTSIDQMRLMMRALLADRFHLVVHTITADAPVMALTLVHSGATGPNLRPHPASDTCAGAVTVGDLPPACGVISHVASSAPGQHYGGRGVPLALLATSVPTMTGLAANPYPVVDQTGLTGLYDFTLNWLHNPNAGATIADSDESIIAENTAAFREALRRQLGLELKPSRAPLNFLIVNHVDHPSAN